LNTYRRNDSYLLFAMRISVSRAVHSM